MSSYRKVLVVLLAGFGACLGFHESAYSCEGWSLRGGLVSHEMLVAFCPLWLLSGDSLERLRELLQALMGVFGAGVSLCLWNLFGGREFVAALREGVECTRARQFWLGMAAWIGTSVALAELVIYVGHPFPGWQAQPWLQVAGVLSFAPGLWALLSHRRLVALLEREPRQILSGSDFRLSSALVSPLVTAPALYLLLPYSSVSLHLNMQVRNLVEGLSEKYLGPWPVTFGLAAVGAGLGTMLALAAGCREARRRGVLLTLAALLILGVDSRSCFPLETHSAPMRLATTYHLVPLDSALQPHQVACYFSAPTATPSNRWEEMRGTNRLAAQALANWDASEAVRILNNSGWAWQLQNGGIFLHLLNLRPADLPLQGTEAVNRALSCEWLDGKTLRSASSNPQVEELRKRLAHPLQPVGSVSGQILLDGQVVAGARLRLQRIPTQGGAAWVAQKLSDEETLGRNGGSWGVVSALQSFYAVISSDGQGRFQATGLESGDYELVLRWEGAQEVHAVRAPGIFHLNADQSLELGTINLTAH